LPETKDYALHFFCRYNTFSEFLADIVRFIN